MLCSVSEAGRFFAGCTTRGYNLTTFTPVFIGIWCGLVFQQARSNSGALGSKPHLVIASCIGKEHATWWSEDSSHPPWGVWRLWTTEHRHISRNIGILLHHMKRWETVHLPNDCWNSWPREEICSSGLSEVQQPAEFLPNIDKMRSAVWASLFHSMSTDASPQHQRCPEGVDSKCFYQKVLARGEQPGSHQDHPSHTALSWEVAEKVLPVYRRMSDENLLRRMVHGGTQNMNKCLNSTIRAHCLKTSIFWDWNMLKEVLPEQFVCSVRVHMNLLDSWTRCTRTFLLTHWGSRQKRMNDAWRTREMQPLRSKHDAIATVGSKPRLRMPEMVMWVWCNKNSRRVKQRLGRKTTSWASGIRTRRMFSYGARSTEKVNAGWDRQGNVKLKFKLVQDYKQHEGCRPVWIRCRPGVSDANNKNMGGVDKQDQLLQPYDCSRKSTKWTKKLFFHFMQCLLVIRSSWPRRGVMTSIFWMFRFVMFPDYEPPGYEGDVLDDQVRLKDRHFAFPIPPNMNNPQKNKETWHQERHWLLLGTPNTGLGADFDPVSHIFLDFVTTTLLSFSGCQEINDIIKKLVLSSFSVCVFCNMLWQKSVFKLFLRATASMSNWLPRKKGYLTLTLSLHP